MDRVQILNEARYAERLCQRTARLYRRAQSVGVFFTVLSGSAVMASAFDSVPRSVSLSAALAFAALGAAMLAVRPADKAAANEADVKRYAALRTQAASMSDEQLMVALQKARESDAPEVEPLRDVAYNDLVTEIGRADCTVPLTRRQKLLAALA